jgi:hypothetical protein
MTIDFFIFFIFLFCLQLQFYDVWGVSYTIGKNSRPFQWYISHPQIPKVSVAKPKYQICTCLTTVDQAGKKNRNQF